MVVLGLKDNFLVAALEGQALGLTPATQWQIDKHYTSAAVIKTTTVITILSSQLGISSQQRFLCTSLIFDFLADFIGFIL